MLQTRNGERETGAGAEPGDTNRGRNEDVANTSRVPVSTPFRPPDLADQRWDPILSPVLPGDIPDATSY
jgi:hypothetical protein